MTRSAGGSTRRKANEQRIVFGFAGADLDLKPLIANPQGDRCRLRPTPPISRAASGSTAVLEYSSTETPPLLGSMWRGFARLCRPCRPASFPKPTENLGFFWNGGPNPERDGLSPGGRRIRTLGPTGTILGHLTPLAYAEVRRPCPGPERSKSGSPKRSGRFRSAAKNRVSSRTWPIASFTAYLRRGRATDDTAVRPSLTA